MSDETVKLEGPTGTKGAIGVAGTAEGPTAVTLAEQAAEVDNDAPATPDPNDAPIQPAEPQDQAMQDNKPTTVVGPNYLL